MRAIRVSSFGGPEVLTLEDVDRPVPGPGQVLVKLHAAGVNPVDTYIRSGAYGALPELPYTPGFDGAGEVAEVVPAGVQAPPWPTVGARVWVGKRGRDGTYAQYVVCDPEQVHPLPPRLSFAQGAGVYVACCTAWRAVVHRAAARAGEIALVHGASGGVGLMAVRIARALGLGVIGTASTTSGRTAVLDHGAHAVVDHFQPGYEREIQRLAAGGLDGKFAGARGVDVVIEMLANVNLQRDLDLLAPRGRVVVVGNRGEITINPRSAMGKEASVVGMSLMNLTPAESREVCAGVQGMLESGVLTPMVGRQMALSDAPRAHEAVMSRGALGKVVLVIPG